MCLLEVWILFFSLCFFHPAHKHPRGCRFLWALWPRTTSSPTYLSQNGWRIILLIKFDPNSSSSALEGALWGLWPFTYFWTNISWIKIAGESVCPIYLNPNSSFLEYKCAFSDYDLEPAPLSRNSWGTKILFPEHIYETLGGFLYIAHTNHLRL